MEEKAAWTACHSSGEFTRSLRSVEPTATMVSCAQAGAHGLTLLRPQMISVLVEAQVTTGAREDAIGAVRDADVVMDGEIIS
jgi:hypothetical protein